MSEKQPLGSSDNRQSFRRKMSFKARSFDVTTFDKLVDDQSTKDFQAMYESLRIQTKKFLATSLLGQIYTNCLLLLSALSCFQYIVQTYLNEDYSGEEQILNVFDKVEIFLAALFAFDWFLYFFLADHKSEYFFRFIIIIILTILKNNSFFAMIDFATVVPIWLTKFVFTRRVQYSNITTFAGFCSFMLYGADNLRILRALRLRRKFIGIDDEVKRSLLNMMLSVITMILFEAALMQYLEEETQPLPFHCWMYYLVITIATVGYGDIAPLSLLGRIWAMFIVLSAIISIPQQTNELIEKMNRYSIYSRAHYDSRPKSKHVVICGDLSSVLLKEFFSELFHEDHENLNLHAVILQLEPPSIEMFDILRDPLFSLHIHYLQGSPLLEADLVRAKANTAIAIILMTNKFSSNPDVVDAKTILENFSIKRFIKKHHGIDPAYCCQLLRPENRRHLTEEMSSQKEVIICLNELKMGIIAKTIVYPGFSTLLFNLLCSFSDEDEFDSEDILTSFDESEDERKYNGDWLTEYRKGCDYEIYSTDLADVFTGVKFIDVAVAVHEKLGILLFGLRITELGGKGQSKFLLNPADYVIPSKDLYKVEGFVLAKNKVSSDMSFKDVGGSTGLATNISSITNALKKPLEATLFEPASLLSKVRLNNSTVVPILSNDISSVASNNQNSQAQPPKRLTGWQPLAPSESTDEESKNKRERLQKLEDEYLRLNYYIRTNHPSLEDVTVKSFFSEEYPNIENHIVIVGKALSNLYDLIRPLRSKHLGKLKHIVILHPTPIPHVIWRRISIFDGIYFVRGSPLQESDIRRAGIFRAIQVVVLADAVVDESKREKGGASGLDALVDAEAIFCYHCVKRLNEQANVVVEIVKQQNVSYLDPGSKVGSQTNAYKFTPPFSSGTLFTSSMLDSIICQAFYNPHVMEAVTKLVEGVDSSNNMLHNNMQLIQRRVTGLNTITGSSLYQIPMPPGLEKKTYGDLVKHLASEKMLALGLLRGLFPEISVGPKSNKMPYVYTNPSNDTDIYEFDRVFVLSQNVIIDDKEVIKDPLNTFSGNASTNSKPQSPLTLSYRKRAPSMDDDSVDGLREEIQELASSQRRLEKIVISLAQDINKRFDELSNSDGTMKSSLKFTPVTDTSPVTTAALRQHLSFQRANSRSQNSPQHNDNKQNDDDTL